MASPSPKSEQSSPPPVWNGDTLDINAWSDLFPGRRAPRGAVERDEGYWPAVDNEHLYWQAWFSGDKKASPRATVALMHGYGEHSSRYDHVAVALVRAGFNVIAFDARGHGRSTGTRGYVERFARYVDDMAVLKRRALDRWPETPLFVLGHSNGGLIALRYALRKPDGIEGFLISSPLCGLAMKVPPPKKALAKLTSRLVPKLALPSGLTPDMVSAITEVVDNYRDDPLVFDIATTRWFAEATDAMEDLYRRASDLDQPFLFMVAGADRIVCSHTTENLFHRLGSLDRELEVFPELNHEILNEQPWRTILSRMILWMERHRAAA